QTGTFSLYKMSGYSISSFIFFAFLIGVITKSATFPFHTWLPDASVAPTPVTAFLHAAVLVKIGVYGLLRIYWKTLVVEGNINWVLYLCVFSSLIAGVIALIEKDIKKILAYSTVSQLGFLLSGILSLNPKSIEGVLIFYIAHAIGKGGLFLTAGIIEKIFETKDITKMGGLMRNYPILTGGFLFSMLSVIGFPPFLGFFGKINIITGFLFNKNLMCSFLLMLSSILTLLYMWRIFSYVFISRNGTLIIKPVNGLNYMNFSVIICGFFSFFLGILYLFLKGGFFGY
ncbi:MAG: NADH-quinone oxidoreductase subunit L, partial [bacterium]|nr:NADH-quinone oxidoreductase subunit L [bacterium]MDW8164372.1 proton-conducting transporter membrane subunit [Candidatus Omnitrophota bacterium]